MRLEWLEDILAVIETGSFNAAAKKRLLTQPAFSRRVRAIEDYVGVELFDRTHKPIQLRPATEDQYDQISRLAASLRQLVHDLKRGDRTTGNRVVIASQHSLTTALTPSLIQRIQERDPNTYMRLRSANLDECFSLLLSRQADIALVYRPVGEDHPVEGDYLESVTLGQDQLIPVYSTAGRSKLNALFVEGTFPLIAYPGEVFFGQIMDRLILPRVRNQSVVETKVETALTLAAMELATQGIGVAWVPASLARSRIGDGRLADLSATLPSSVLDCTVARLIGSRGRTEDAVWHHFLALET